MRYFRVTEEFIKWANDDLPYMIKYISFQLQLINESKCIDSISSKV